jgi:hypothetical protein
MDMIKSPELEPQDGATAQTDRIDADDAPAWEEIVAGRFMPRRIRGSCKGRVLG